MDFNHISKWDGSKFIVCGYFEMGYFFIYLV